MHAHSACGRCLAVASLSGTPQATPPLTNPYSFNSGAEIATGPYDPYWQQGSCVSETGDCESGGGCEKAKCRSGGNSCATGNTCGNDDSTPQVIAPQPFCYPIPWLILCEPHVERFCLRSTTPMCATTSRLETGIPAAPRLPPTDKKGKTPTG